MVQNLESPGLSGRVDSPAMQCTRQQFLTQLASHQFLMVVIVLAFFNRVQKGAPWIRDLTKIHCRIQETFDRVRLLTEIREAGFTKICAQMWIGKENDVRESDE